MTSLLPRALATLLCVAVLSACTTGAAGPVAESPASIAPRPPLAELDVRARTGATIVAIERSGSVTPNPDPSEVLLPGDRLLAIGQPAAVDRLRALVSGEGDPSPDQGSALVE